MKTTSIPRSSAIGIAAAALATFSLAAEDSFPVQMSVDTTKPAGPWKPVWRFFGADEPNYATMTDGRALLGELGEMMPDQVFFRAHSLLCSGDGTPALKWGSTGVYGEDGRGRPIYDWTIVDEIFDAYRENGVRPYVQLGFMPEALSIKPHPYQHSWTPKAKYEEIYTGWAHPPKDYGKWGELCHQWTLHCIERYGLDEVNHWYWQTWNEPNIPYWQGTRDEFFKLHDYAIDGVRRANPKAKVGGPDVAGGPGGDFLDSFIRHCLEGTNHATGEKGTPLDFISFHAKGWPEHKDGFVRMGIANQLRDINAAFAVIAKRPETKDLPIVIGESDPEGCAACQGPNLAYRNGTMYSSYTAASFIRKLDLADKHGVNLEGALTWAFEFEGHPYFAGFRALATRGIDKPVLNVFRMMSKMKGERLAVSSEGAVPLDAMLKSGVREKPDVHAAVTRSGNQVAILLWHYHDFDLPGPAADITLTLDGLGEAQVAHHYRVDENHSNAYTLWLALGSPQDPTADQITELKEAGQLDEIENAATVTNENGATKLSLSLPRQAVSLVILEAK